MSLKPRRVDFDATWGVILETVRGVVTLDKVARATWNDRFSDVYALCVAYPEPLGDRLYQETKRFLEDHVREKHDQVAACTQSTQLLQSYHKNWSEYNQGSAYLNSLYGYLNSQFIKKAKYSEADLNYGNFGIELTEQMLEIGELALETWKKFMTEPLKDRLVGLLLAEIKADRCGSDVNEKVVHSIVHSFVLVDQYKKKSPLALYENMFEKTLLEETADYYRAEAAKLIETLNCSDYMEKVLSRLDDESYRVRKFLHPSSYDKVIRVCQKRMIEDHLECLHEFCPEIVKAEQQKDLANMYKLLKPTSDGLKTLIAEVQEHIKEVGQENLQTVLKSDNVPSQFVEVMLNVHAKYHDSILNTFQGDPDFMEALDKACASVINWRPNQKTICRSPELLAKFCDNLLKKSVKGMSESEIDDKLASSITIFKYLDDKDVYQKFYSRMLARRLINFQSQSMDAEEGMINRLKQACGYEFTNKLHRMFTDMNISEDLNTKFANFLQNSDAEGGSGEASLEQRLGINFSVLVLTAGSWPFHQSNIPTLTIPQELVKSVQKFENFYNTNFSGRKLTWMHHLCTVEVKVTYLKKPYIVTMGTLQMALLMPFNSCDTISFQDLVATTTISTKEAQKQLQSLVESKLLLVSESASNSEVDENSAFKLNLNFSSKRTKFKITAAVAKETPQETEQAQTAIDEDRKLYLQAAIVRIMKARKVLKHNLLIQEVISQSRARFAPSIPMIKKCIEALIDKQYLERTQNSTDEYSYVA